MHHQETDLTLYLELGRPKLAKANDDEFSKAAKWMGMNERMKVESSAAEGTVLGMRSGLG